MNNDEPLVLYNTPDLLYFPGFDPRSKFVDVSGSTLENLLIEVVQRNLEIDDKIWVTKQNKSSSKEKRVQIVVTVKNLYELHEKKYDGSQFELPSHIINPSYDIRKTA